MKFQLLIKTKILHNKDCSCCKLSDNIFILLINVKMPTAVGILTFISRIVELSMKSFITFFKLDSHEHRIIIFINIETNE